MQPAIDVHSHMLDRYRRMKLVVAHGDGTLPFLAPRLDRCFEPYAGCRTVVSEPPSAHLRRRYADSALFPVDTQKLTLAAFGKDQVVYGTDFPHGLSDMAVTLDRIGALDAPVRDQIRGANAERLFGILRAARAP